MCQAESLAIVPGTIPIASIVANSATATGLEWQAPAAGGKVLQVVEGTTTTFTTSTSNTFIDTNLTATITPSSATSKILVIANQAGCTKTTGNIDNNMQIRLMRDSTEISISKQIGFTETNVANRVGSTTLVKLDSPASTSAITYKTQFRNEINTSSVTVQQQDSASAIILIEIGA